MNTYKLTEADRMAQAAYHRPRWLGPIEHHECDRHPGCFESWRWTWKGAREDIQDGHTEHVQGCSECDREEPLDELE